MLNTTQTQKLIALYNEGIALKSIAERMGAPIGQVTYTVRMLQETGEIQRRRPHYCSGKARARTVRPYDPSSEHLANLLHSWKPVR